MKNRFLFSIIIAFALGVLFATVFHVSISLILFFLVLGSALLLFVFIFQNHTSSRVFFVGLIFLALGLGMLRFNVADVPPPESIESAVPAEVTLVGTVVAEPDERSTNTQLRVEIEKIAFATKKKNENGLLFQKIPEDTKVLLFAPRHGKYQYGDKVRVSGKLEKPENFVGENGKTFDYVHYLGKDGVEYTMHYPSVKVLSSGNGFWVKGELFALKDHFLAVLSKLFPEPQNALMGGLLVGVKHSLGDDLLNDFQRVGVIHVVVLSGYNVSLVADFIMRIFAFLPMVLAGSLGGVGILLFVVLAGGSSTAVRAGAMAILIIFARATGRTADMLRLLFIVGFFMLLWNPKILLYDPSFQLSFLATFGLLALSPTVSRWLHFLPEKYSIREIVSATVATQIFVLPVILFMMGNVSFISVPVNLAVLIFIPVTMLLGFIAGVIGFFSVHLALPFAYIGYLFLSYEIGAVKLAANAPKLSFIVHSFPLWGMFLVYLGYAGIFFFYRKKRARQTSALPGIVAE